MDAALMACGTTRERDTRFRTLKLRLIGPFTQCMIGNVIRTCKERGACGANSVALRERMIDSTLYSQHAISPRTSEQWYAGKIA